MNLTAHFTMEELTRSEVGARLGIDNSAPEDVWPALNETARRLEDLRTLLLGSPVVIHSCYRSPVINHLVGGVPTSAHLSGFAVDFTAAGWENMDAAQKIAASGMDFDQLILEYGWVHISFDPQMRRQIMTKKSAAAPYEAGLVA